MFIEKTLLILGAGASKPYGFPLGAQLINDIVDCIKNDAVFFPLIEKTNRLALRTGNPISISDYDIFMAENLNPLTMLRSAIKNKKQLKQCAQPKGSYIDASAPHCIDGYRYGVFGDQDLIRVPLNRITELVDLANMLEIFDPISIDAFLRDHPEHRVSGQTMIIYCLIKCHNSSLFRKQLVTDNCQQGKQVLGTTEQDNWYRYLLNDIKSGCQKSSELSKNDLSIMTFNYDISLDWYLKDRLLKTSFFSDYAEQYLNKELTIEHIYGSICDITEINEFYDLTQNDITDVEQDLINFHHLLYGYLESLPTSSRIKLIGARNADQSIIDRIKYADKVAFIGFGFDRDNLDVLGFPREKSKYRSFLSGNDTGGITNKKKIFYLDFGGKMQNLNNEFLELETISPLWNQGSPWLKITRSTGTSITDAYVNDFREGLFT